jgi:ATP-dependent RNA circularization protein (DNA/RNA ligase family)
MEKELLEQYWTDLPIGAEHAVDYPTLCEMWGKSQRETRRILHELSHFDNGDDFVLIRSSKTRGFYKTDNEEVIKEYRKECLNKGRSIFAPVKKINRILQGKADALQYSVFNNLKAVRVSKNLSQPDVCELMKKYDISIDVPTLSKMENGVFLPTPYQLAKLAEIYAVEAFELVAVDLYTVDIFG